MPFKFFCCWIVGVLYIFSDISPYQTFLANTFSHSTDCLFIVWVISFTVQSFSVWYSPTCSVSFCLCFSYDSQKIIAKTYVSRNFFLCIIRSFMVLGVMCKSLLQFDLILVSGIRQFHSSCIMIFQFPSTSCWKASHFCIECSWLTCQILVSYISMAEFQCSWFCFIALFLCVYASTSFDDESFTR